MNLRVYYSIAIQIGVPPFNVSFDISPVAGGETARG